MVVPKAGEEDTCPQPSFELLKNVKEYLDRRRPVGIELTLLGPEYVNVGITAELVWAPDRSTATLVAGIEKRLNAFLHPTTGGPDRLRMAVWRAASCVGFLSFARGVRGAGLRSLTGTAL